MTERVPTPADRYHAARARRRRARRVMQTVTVVCVLTAAGIGAEQFSTGGLELFLQRPAGVGATPPNPASDAATPAPATGVSARGAP